MLFINGKKEAIVVWKTMAYMQKVKIWKCKGKDYAC